MESIENIYNKKGKQNEELLAISKVRPYKSMFDQCRFQYRRYQFCPFKF